jgi:hypothetical protein
MEISMTISEKARKLMDDLPAFAEYCSDNLDNIARDELDVLQLEALQYRYSSLRDEIPILKKLVEAEGISAIDNFCDAVPLLFDHTVYKSYPASLLENNRFTQLNKWLNKLTSYDLLDVDVSACQSIDEWMATMDTQTPLRISHSSGTSGTMSFLPHSANEWEKVGKLKVMTTLGLRHDAELPDMHVIYPYYRSGSSSHLRANDGITQYLLKGNEDNFHAAYPTRLSSDLQYLFAKVGAARAKGTLDRLKISPAQQEKKAEFEQLQAEMPQHLERFFGKTFRDLQGKHVFMQATWNLLHNMAKAGLEQGIAGVFSSDCHITTGGGAKGMIQPEGWIDDVMRFTGAQQVTEIYAMSEVLAGNQKCERGHYHFSPTAIPFVLDPDTSELLPRKGRVTGRAALFDLSADARWGGFISGDEITVEWDAPCPCGRTSRYIVGDIQRFSDKHGGDDKITCAASEGANKEAMDFLNDQTT